MKAVDYPVVLVPSEERDLGFIIAHWIESNRPHYVPISAWKHAVRESVLGAVTGGKVVVAHDPLDRDHLYGFSVSVDGVLRYVFVKNSRRRAGLGRALVEGLSGYAPGPRAGEMWARRRGLKARKA